MSNSNSNLKEDATGNVTQGRLVQIKLDKHPQSYRWEIRDNEKVWNVCALYVDYVEFEHHPKTREIIYLEIQLEAIKEEILGSNSKISEVEKK